MFVRLTYSMKKFSGFIKICPRYNITILILKDGDYAETTKKFEVQYDNMEEYLKKLVQKKKKRKKKVEDNEDDD